jgi:hypothetical protein
MRPELVFRGAPQNCAYNPKEISSFAPELVFRQIPGKSVERGRHPQGLRRRLGGIAELDAIGRRVAAIRRPPPCLRLLAPRRLAFRLAARPLPYPYSRIGREPVVAD